MQFVVNIESLGQSSEEKTIWGEIWVEDSGVAFPEAHWTDLSLGVLRALGEAISELLRGESMIASAPFFDGPFEVVFCDKTKAQWEMIFRDRRAKIIDRRFVVTATEVRESFLNCAEKVLSECYRRNLQSNDVGGLMALVNRMEGEQVS